MVNEFNSVMGKAKTFPYIQFNDAENFLKRGLRYFIGDNAVWLDGYNGIADWLADNRGKGLCVLGTNGLGKSVICYDILPVFFKYYKPESRLFKCRAIELGMSIKNRIDYANIVMADVVVVDDFGIENVMNNYGEKYDAVPDIIDIAEKMKKLLIMTSNLSVAGITARYGERTADRLRSITKGLLIEGKSLR